MRILSIKGAGATTWSLGGSLRSCYVTDGRVKIVSWAQLRRLNCNTAGYSIIKKVRGGSLDSPYI